MPDEDVQLDIFGQELPLEEVSMVEPEEEPANLDPGTYDPATVQIPF